MNIQNKKVLITGGGSGIGFSIAKAFSEAGAIVILVGRNEEKLINAVAYLRDASYIVADVSNENDVERLVRAVNEEGGIDILVNNAGIVYYVPALMGDDDHAKAKEEMEINFFAVLNLIQKFLPVLRKRGDAAIVNLESILSYVPTIYAATYSATKAALHSYSQSLRLQLQNEGIDIKIFEVFPPLVDTAATAVIDLPKISPDVIASDLLDAMLKNNFYVRTGFTEDIYQACMASPEHALLLMNGQ